MGPFMVEIVFCRVTRRGRKKKAGMNKAGRENMRNDGPMQSFIPKDDFVKVTLDLSDNGPVFGALDDMMLKLSLEGNEKKAESGGAKKALKNLLKSGIPGIEGMFAPADAQPKGFGKKGGKKGFHKMNDGSKKKFMTAIFGEDGTQIDTATAAALLAATCSGGNPEIGNRLAELLVPNMGDTVDPTMMAALMSACSLINAGASTEEVMKAMMLELADSGMSEEEILEKTQLLMKSFGKEEVGSTAEYKLLSKQKNKALVKLEIPPKDFTAIVLAHKAIAACGTTPENVAKILIILSTLGKKGANPMHVAAALKNLGQISDDTKAEVIESIVTAWGNTGKISKTDVGLPVRMHMALDNENEPGWTEVKNLKDIVGGVSPNSQEAIELNLARGVKAAGLKKDDIGRANMVMKAITCLGVDMQQLAKIMFLEKTICENGVPATEVGRVLTDGLMPPEATQGLIDEAKATFNGDMKPNDVEAGVTLYNNLKIKSNNPLEIIEYVDKTLIQVRCSLEDVADNMFSTMSARGEKESKIVRDVTETLKKTGASACVVSATIMPPLKEMTGKSEVDLTKVIGRNLKEVNYDNDDVKSAMTEMVNKILDEDPQQHQSAVDALTSVFKDLGESPFAIKDFVASNLPPPPTPPEEIERRRQVAEELAKLEREEQERARIKEMKERGEDPEAEIVNKNLKVGGGSESRRGSLTIGGTERRGSYYDSSVTTRASVAVVTDDPDNKKKVKESLSQVFEGGMANGIEGEISPADVEHNADGTVTVGGHKLPPGVMVKESADGSLVLVDKDNNPIPAEQQQQHLGGATARKSSSSTSAQTSGNNNLSMTSCSVGKTISEKDIPAAANVVANPDGTATIVSPTGACVIVAKNPDGSLTVLSNVQPQPDSGGQLGQGASQLAEMLLAPGQAVGGAGAISMNRKGEAVMDGPPSGFKLVKNPQGQNVLVSEADGTAVPVSQTSDGKLVIDAQTVVNLQAGQRSSGPQGAADGKHASAARKTGAKGILSAGGAPIDATAGSVVMKEVPPGFKLERGADGSSVLVNASTGAKLEVSQDAAGGIIISKPDKLSDIGGAGLLSNASLFTVQEESLSFADGGGHVVLQSLPPGYTIKKGPDGSKLMVDPKTGSEVKIVTNVDGTMTVIPPDSEPVFSSADGSIISKTDMIQMLSDSLGGGQAAGAITESRGGLSLAKLPPGFVLVKAKDGSMMMTNAQKGISLPVIQSANGSFILSPSQEKPTMENVLQNLKTNKKLPPGVWLETDASGQMTIVDSVHGTRSVVSKTPGGDFKVVSSSQMNRHQGSPLSSASHQSTELPQSTLDAIQRHLDSGAPLPPGVALVTNRDGSRTVTMNGRSTNAMLSTGLSGSGGFSLKVERISGGSSLVSLTGQPGGQGMANGLPEGMDDEALEKMLASSGMSEEEKKKLLGAFKSAVSAESRELMQKILASSSSQDEMSSRVAALLAGTALSTSRGEKPARSYGEVEQATYDIGDTSVTTKKREDNFEMPEIPSIPTVKIPTEDTTLTNSTTTTTSRPLRRPSIKRQSELMREARKSRQEELEEERKRKASYYRRVTGLRKAKVPLMVYSCGGFSRCFRLARFYDSEGPPVGLYYERPTGGDERKELNPEL